LGYAWEIHRQLPLWSEHGDARRLTVSAPCRSLPGRPLLLHVHTTSTVADVRAHWLSLGVAVASQRGAIWQTGNWMSIRFIHSVARRRGTRIYDDMDMVTSTTHRSWSWRDKHLEDDASRRSELNQEADSIRRPLSPVGLAPDRACRWWHMPCLHCTLPTR
jgi:hypothetical protein